MARIGDLQTGDNAGAILTCKIIMHLDKYAEVPLSCLIVDSQNSYAVASFYGTNKQFTEKIQPGDLLYIKNPQLIFTSLEFKNKLYSYQCIKVSEITDVLVNDGQSLMDVGAANVAVSKSAPMAA